jgi:hypothetical protein
MACVHAGIFHYKIQHIAINFLEWHTVFTSLVLFKLLYFRTVVLYANTFPLKNNFSQLQANKMYLQTVGHLLITVGRNRDHHVVYTLIMDCFSLLK